MKQATLQRPGVDLNDIFRMLECNSQKIISSYRSNSQAIVEQACALMDRMRLVLHDERKSAVLNREFDELMNDSSGSTAAVLQKKEINQANHIEHLEVPNLALASEQPGMSFGGGTAPQQQTDQLMMLDDELTFHPIQSAIKKPSHHKYHLQEPKSHPVQLNKSGEIHKPNIFAALEQKMREASMQPDPEPSKCLTNPNMDIDELIESTKKMGLQVQKQLEEEDNDVEYNITDYSSNESSNDNAYNIEYREEEDFGETSFGTNCGTHQNLFSGNFASNPNPPKFNFEPFKQLKKAESSIASFPQKPSKQFKPSPLLKSPIKSATKHKRRMYCRNKKIPHWAEDLKKVSEMNFGKDPDQIFGRCIVQNLNSKYLFPNAFDARDHQRTSSAKWNCSLTDM